MFTGPAIITTDQNGNTIARGLGRGAIWDPATPGFGIRFQEGELTQVFDPNGNSCKTRVTGELQMFAS